jgi:hypothetical protein
VTELPGEAFTRVLPLLRRTFATFHPAERRQMGARLRPATLAAADETDDKLDHQRAEAVLPLLAQLLGLVER